jgi:copper homeostasis protein (lipoprotein)
MENTMKKMLTIAAIAAFAVLAVSCNRKKAQPIAAIEAYSDSIYMVNDSTIGDLQTFVYEGVMPSDAGKPANYVLAISSYGLNSDGTYTLTESYTETNGKVSTNYDEGEKNCAHWYPQRLYGCSV